MILDDIVAKKKLTLEESKYIFDIAEIYEKTKNDKIPDFYEALKKDGLSIIGEIKKASPSRGIIKADLDLVKTAKEYEKAVDAVSVLTEENYFLGKPEYVSMIHKEINLPILRKDFIVSPLQITEARMLGASAVLLIAAVLKEKYIIRDYLSIVHGLGMYALVETHSEKEVETALSAGANIIGVNNRNLSDFSEDINTTLKLCEIIGNDALKVSESSIHTADDIKIVSQAGADAVLVGESFMRCTDIGLKAKEFKDAYEYGGIK